MLLKITLLILLFSTTCQPNHLESNFFSKENRVLHYPTRVLYIEGVDLMTYNLSTGAKTIYKKLFPSMPGHVEFHGKYLLHSRKQHLFLVVYEFTGASSEVVLYWENTNSQSSNSKANTIKGRDVALIGMNDGQFGILDEDKIELSVYTLPGGSPKPATEKNMIDDPKPYEDLDVSSIKGPLKFTFETEVDRIFSTPVESTLMFACFGDKIGMGKLVQGYSISTGDGPNMSTKGEGKKSIKLKSNEIVLQDEFRVVSVSLSVLPPSKMKAAEKASVVLVKDKEVRFGIVRVNAYKSEYIPMINPTDEATEIELEMGPEEEEKSCSSSEGIIHPPTFINAQNAPWKYGFSVVEDAVTRVFVQPHEKAVLGPVVFYPSGRCSWTATVIVSSDVSDFGIEVITLWGSGGWVAGSGSTKRIGEFRGFGQGAVEVLVAKNPGELPVEVRRISAFGSKILGIAFDTSGFTLLPGESRKIVLSFSLRHRAHVCNETLLMMLQFVTADGIVQLPVEVRLSSPVIAACQDPPALVWLTLKVFTLLVVALFLVAYILFPEPPRPQPAFNQHRRARNQNRPAQN